MSTKRWKARKHNALCVVKDRATNMRFQTKQVNINRNGKKKKISGEVSPREGA